MYAETKKPQSKLVSLLHFLPTPSLLWSMVSMDFIEDLPHPAGCSMIKVVVHLLTLSLPIVFLLPARLHNFSSNIFSGSRDALPR